MGNVMIDRELLAALIQNTLLLIAEKEWLAGTSAGNGLLAQLRKEADESQQVLDDE